MEATPLGRQDYCEIYDAMYYEKIADIMVMKKML